MNFKMIHQAITSKCNEKQINFDVKILSDDILWYISEMVKVLKKLWFIEIKKNFTLKYLQNGYM